MLRQRQVLALVGGAAGGPVELVRPGDQPFVTILAALGQERHFVRTYFEHGAAVSTSGLGTGGVTERDCRAAMRFRITGLSVRVREVTRDFSRLMIY
jgi:hypothetical protein